MIKILLSVSKHSDGLVQPGSRYGRISSISDITKKIKLNLRNPVSNSIAPPRPGAYSHSDGKDNRCLGPKLWVMGEESAMATPDRKVNN